MNTEHPCDGSAQPHGLADAAAAARRVRAGYLSEHQRDVLATMVLLAADRDQLLPTPVAAATLSAVYALAAPPHGPACACHRGEPTGP